MALTAPTPGLAAARVVGEAMITRVKRTPADATVGDVRRLFGNDHVHAATLVAGGVLVAVVDRDDVADPAVPDSAPVRALGRLSGRVVGPDADLAATRVAMLAEGRRRLVVVAPDGRLLGLLCLKRTLRGFCADTDLAAREAERADLG
ncbi:hypothetical protein [Jatrophihabitans fulvus]